MDDQLARIGRKLETARDSPVAATAFGAGNHGFRLGPRLPESVVVEFEERHEVELPVAYRRFLVELGNGGAGPGYGLTPLEKACGGCRPGHLTRPSPYLPGRDYECDWVIRYEDPWGPESVFLPGTLNVAGHGCSLVTHMTITGPARGRMFNLDSGGLPTRSNAPAMVADADFLAWYERWLDETLAGSEVGQSGVRVAAMPTPLEEAGLLEVLAGDPSAERRSHAMRSLLRRPVTGTKVWAAIEVALDSERDLSVRAELAGALVRHNRLPEPRRQEVVELIRRTGVAGLETLELLGALTAEDLLPELTQPDVERRRLATRLLGWRVTGEVPDAVVTSLLGDEDRLVRAHAVFAANGEDQFAPHLWAMMATETDPWVRILLHQFADDEQWRRRDASTGQQADDGPPF
ncbi:hypothetical protein BJY16_006917 [Actinoplanes octamycinicus]|uniref:Knr4/Smi1-like domain-containing protein n=1 Tax=Actinoplanes octamycinicus TaxID=135948 RepID=A0A7W7H3S1_9ACTN|nr:HEAT repeat domain-containing protein [Actinoplanes octamycinicus]MBB4743458.1 hypothetical protein [Actinoplanes octamycinicus]GIE63455.1 hypothetical protein Aoc01nite_88570 [Actinoplanes octamycinicus]